MINNRLVAFSLFLASGGAAAQPPAQELVRTREASPVPQTRSVTVQETIQETTRAQPTAISGRQAIAVRDAGRARRARELATQPRAELRYIGIEPEQFNAALLGASELYAVISRSRSHPQGNELALESALEIGDILARAADERAALYPSDLESARLAEKQMTLAYWEGRGRFYPQVDLSTRQLSYVARDRFHRLLDAADEGAGVVADLTREAPELRDLLARGEEQAAALSADTKDAKARKLEQFTASFDRFASQLQAGALDLSGVQVSGLLETVVDDLGQMQTYSLTLEAPIAVTVNTLLNGQPDGGHLVRYEVFLDYEIGELQNLRFDNVSSPAQHQLGPFRYYLWTEKDGAPSSEPQVFNLGDPLEPVRSLDIVVRSLPEPEER